MYVCVFYVLNYLLILGGLHLFIYFCSQDMFRRVVSVLRNQVAAGASSAAKKKDGYLTLSFSTPTEVITNNSPVHLLECSTATGDIGVMAEHAAYLAELKPGVVSVTEEKDSAGKRYFVPGGFLVIRDDNTAALTASEAIPLDDLDIAHAKSSLEQFNNDLAKANDDAAKTEARIGVDVFSAMVAALEKKH
jgi:F-type H+-transporting ATPase subunit delta